MSRDLGDCLVRITTLNLWGIEGDWPARRAVLKDGLKSLDPDLILFQESILTPDYDQVTDLLPSDYQVVHQNGRSPDGTGNSVASRLPLGEISEAFLHVTPRVDPRHGWIGSVAALQVRGPDDEFLLVHLKPSWQPNYERERALQSAVASQFIKDSLAGRDMPVIVAGDLDAPPDSASIRFWKQQQRPADNPAYIDAWEAIHSDDPGHTFTPLNPLVAATKWAPEDGRRIDYIFVRGFQIADCSLSFNRPVDGVWASDHFGVTADIGSDA